jgi:prephenate dehydrogenase
MAIATVVGGAGRMGAWFANFLAANGYKVIICDKNEPAARKLAKRRRFKFISSETRAAELSDIIILAAPTGATKALLRRIVPHTPKTTLLVEISSIKEPVRRAIQSLTKRGVQILSIHPMFGPGAKNLAGKAILVAQEPPQSQFARNLLSIFSKKGAKIIRSNLNDHDQIVATTLALPHMMNFAFIETLKHAGVSFNKIRAIGGTTFRLQLLLAAALCHESPYNEASILADNKCCRSVFATFAQQINQIRNTAQKRPRSELMNRIRNDAAYVRKDPMFRTAYERFTAAVEAPSHR